MSSHGVSPTGSAWTITPLTVSVMPVRRTATGAEARPTSSSAATHCAVTSSAGEAASR